jgi:broad specificity phosphatase PhoE
MSVQLPDLPQMASGLAVPYSPASMPQEALLRTELSAAQAPRLRRHADAMDSLRIVLIRHGRPAIEASPRTSHRGFRHYIDAYEAAGLDPASAPPGELQDLAAELDSVFTSDRPRAHDSARVLAPKAELIADPLFIEAPLASPRIPLLRMRVPKWAVVARILWHAGFHPEIENYRRAKRRAASAADILIARARVDGVAVLVAHGYFNLMIGRELRRRGFEQSGSHRVRYWNAVTYELPGQKAKESQP